MEKVPPSLARKSRDKKQHNRADRDQ